MQVFGHIIYYVENSFLVFSMFKKFYSILYCDKNLLSFLSFRRWPILFAYPQLLFSFSVAFWGASASFIFAKGNIIWPAVEIFFFFHAFFSSYVLYTFCSAYFPLLLFDVKNSNLFSAVII